MKARHVVEPFRRWTEESCEVMFLVLRASLHTLEGSLPWAEPEIVGAAMRVCAFHISARSCECVQIHPAAWLVAVGHMFTVFERPTCPYYDFLATLCGRQSRTLESAAAMIKHSL